MGEDVEDDGGATMRLWAGFPPERAIQWSRVLRVHWPSWPGAPAMWRITAGLAHGRPAAERAWAERAREAEDAGLTPALYDRLQLALDAIPAVEHPAHPDNAPDPRWPVHTIRPFDAALWLDWPWLAARGWSDEEAARLLLTGRELLDPAG